MIGLGCVKTEIERCSVLCGETEVCPAGMSCGSDGFCYRPGQPICSVPDGPSLDTPGPDTPTVDAPPLVVYGNSHTSLYRIDPVTRAPTFVGNFDYPGGGGHEMADLAYDKDGTLLGVTSDLAVLWRIDPTTAACQEVLDLPADSYWAAGGAPDGVYLAGPMNLYRYADGGVEPLFTFTDATVSGDVLWHPTAGLLLSLDHGGTVDSLASWTPSDGVALLGQTGLPRVWGLALSGDRLLAFDQGGEISELDPETGAAIGTTVDGGVEWIGAAP